MKQILSRDIYLGYLVIVSFAITLILGFFN